MKLLSIDLVTFIQLSLCALVSIFYAAYAYQVSKKNTEDRALALYKSRKVSLAAMGSQTLLFFLCSFSDTPAQPGLLYFVSIYFIFLIIVQAQIQSSLERKIRDIKATHFEMFKHTIKAILFVLALYGLYLTVIGGVSIVVSFILHLNFLSATAKNLIFDLGLVLAIFLGVFSMPLAAPFLFRIFTPSSRVKDPETIKILENCFKKANLNIPSFWTIDNENLKNFNAMVTGLSIGRGPFKPALFFTKALIDKFSKPEFEAIMLHEVSHISLGHIRKRFVVLLLITAVLLIPTLMIVFMAGMGSPKNIPTVGLVAYLLNWVGQNYFLRLAVRRQELEADENAIRLGADLSAFESALEKLNLLNDQIKNKKDPMSYLCAGCAHPTVQERIETVRNLDTSQPLRSQSAISATFGPFFKSKFLGPAYAAMVAGFFAFGFIYVKPRYELISASSKGDIAQIKRLLDSGVSANVRDPFGTGDFPLYAAVSSEQVSSVKYLLEHGANVNQIHPYKSQTALFAAAKKGHTAISAMLIFKGAKVNAKDSDGNTPLEWALKNHATQVAGLLNSSGGILGHRAIASESP